MTLTPRRQGHKRTTVEKVRAAAFLVALHAAPFIAIARGTNRGDWLTALVMYFVLALLIGSGLHRYFAHHAYATSRVFQFVLGAGTCLTFTDPVGFSGKHRIHHRYSDTEDDVHNPDDGWWSCWIWNLADDGLSDDDVVRAAPDLARVPELMWLHRWFWAPGVTLATLFFVWGGFSRVAIGYGAGLLTVLHLTSAVNYVCHRWGTRRYDNADASRNNLLVALLTQGEGWHNNHHHYPAAARAGFARWEIDVNYLLIRTLAAVGIVWNVREVPAQVRARGGIL